MIKNHQLKRDLPASKTLKKNISLGGAVINGGNNWHHYASVEILHLTVLQKKTLHDNL